MKKIYFVVAVLTLVLMSSTALAQQPKNELCLTTESSDQGVTTKRTLVLTYTGLAAGHVIFYGEGCYVISEVPPFPEVSNCSPVIGSGLLHDDKLEFNVQGVEYHTEYGVGVLISTTIHVLLSIDTLAGTYAGESVYYIGNERQEIFESGPMTAVKCPAVTSSEVEADKLFKKLIKQLDSL